MISLEKSYYSKKSMIVLKVLSIAASFVICVFIAPCNTTVAFLSGAFFVYLVLSFVKPMLRPKVRLCEHFLILNHYRDVVSWNKIVRVRLKGDTLLFDIQKQPTWWNEYSVSLSYILKKEELLDDIKALCEAKNIPFEELHSDSE